MCLPNSSGCAAGKGGLLECASCTVSATLQAENPGPSASMQNLVMSWGWAELSVCVCVCGWGAVSDGLLRESCSGVQGPWPRDTPLNPTVWPMVEEPQISCALSPPPPNTLALSQPSLPPRCRHLFILPGSRVRDSEFTSQLLDLGPGDASLEAASFISKIKPGNIFRF